MFGKIGLFAICIFDQKVSYKSLLMFMVMSTSEFVGLFLILLAHLLIYFNDHLKLIFDKKKEKLVEAAYDTSEIYFYESSCPIL